MESTQRAFKEGITHYFPKTIHFFSFIQTELANKVFCRALSFYNDYFGKENQTKHKMEEEICHDAPIRHKKIEWQTITTYHAPV